jgi:hypothetical protein
VDRCILDLGTSWKRVSASRLGRFILRHKCPRYSLDRRLLLLDTLHSDGSRLKDVMD